MSSKKDKPAAPAAAASDAASKRSPLKLAVFALVPVLLAGGGYFGWTFLAGEPEAAHASEAAEGHGGADGMHVSALPAEIAAETSFTYSFALSELLNGSCGPIRAEALKAASAQEALNDGVLVNLSWMAANRRIGTITKRSCEHMVAEIENEDGKAIWKAREKAAAEKDGGAAQH